MSRTIRRKGKEPSWLLDDEEFVARIWHRTLVQHKARYHSDSWDVRGAGKWVKRRWAKWRRQHDRQEFAKMAKEEYEPNWFQTQIDTWWWD